MGFEGDALLRVRMEVLLEWMRYGWALAECLIGEERYSAGVAGRFGGGDAE